MRATSAPFPQLRQQTRRSAGCEKKKKKPPDADADATFLCAWHCVALHDTVKLITRHTTSHIWLAPQLSKAQHDEGPSHKERERNENHPPQKEKKRTYLSLLPLSSLSPLSSARAPSRRRKAHLPSLHLRRQQISTAQHTRVQKVLSFFFCFLFARHGFPTLEQHNAHHTHSQIHQATT